MLSVIGSGERTWNPHCNRGEAAGSQRMLRRKDLWFFLGVMLFLVLIFFIWQQNRGLRLAAEVARLELRREALRTQVIDRGVVVAQLSQPEWLLAEAKSAGDLADLDLESRIFVPAPAREEGGLPARDTWLASVGFGVGRALAAEGD